MTTQEKYAARLNSVGLNASQKDRGGVVRFQRITAVEARRLLDSGCADPEGNTNGSPTFLEITEFLEENPSFVAHGYIVVQRRPDERITLEGVAETQKPSQEEIDNFTKMFQTADEFTLNPCKAWYD